MRNEAVAEIDRLNRVIKHYHSLLIMVKSTIRSLEGNVREVERALEREKAND